jgi:hypothetical protein
MDKTKPNHYRNSVIQPIDIWRDWGLEPDASVATCIKYLKRAGTKAGETSGDDYLKAIWFLVNAVTGTSQVADEVVTLVKEHSLFEFTETGRDTVDKQEQMMR